MITRTIRSGKGIGALSFQGEPGNPVLFRGDYRGELCALLGDRGGKSVLRNHLEDVVLTEVSNAKALSDVDERPLDGVL